MNTKLIIVEGLPGFGKSTTAKLIQKILETHQVDCELFSEGNLDHPADFEGVAYYTTKDFEDLLSSHTIHAKNLREQANNALDGYFIPYQKMKANLSDELYNLLGKNDIYELPLDKHIPLLLTNWRAFVEAARFNNKIYIFECCFIQNPVTIGMIKYNAPNKKVTDYVLQLGEIIEPLSPLLIYVDQQALRKTFEKTVKERSSSWSEGFINYYTNQEYGLAHGLTGYEGTVKILEARKTLENDIVEQLNIKRVKVDNTSYNITQYECILEDILNENLIQVGR